MIGTVVVSLLLVGLVGAVLFRSVRIVPDGSVDIVERLGRYRRTLEPGVSMIVPVFDLVRVRLDMHEQAVSVPPAPVVTSDGHKVAADVLVHYQVTDPVAAVYEISDVRMGIEQLVVTSMRAAAADLDLDQAWSARRDLRDMLRQVFEEVGEKWGIQVTHLEVRSIERVSDER